MKMQLVHVMEEIWFWQKFTLKLELYFSGGGVYLISISTDLLHFINLCITDFMQFSNDSVLHTNCLQLLHAIIECMQTKVKEL